MLSDGGNLYLQVTIGDDGNVRRSWVFRYQLKGRRVRDMGLGSADTFGLAGARERATEYRKLLSEGIDPIAHRDAQVARNLAAHASAMTFDQACENYVRQHRAGWKSPVHARQWTSTLRTYASPIIGKLPVETITTPIIMKLLNPIWTEKPVTASRVRARIEAVIGLASASGFRKGPNGEELPNPARWKDHLDALLPPPAKLQKVRPQPALPYLEMPVLMEQLRARKGPAALALQYCILTAVRTHDVRHAKWADIDLKARVWVIPEFSKIGGEHRVPLSDAALAVVDQVRKMAGEIGGAVGGSEHLFPNDVSGARLSENALLGVIERMGRKGTMTTHGCRASFRTFCQEKTSFPREVCEQALGHVVGSKVERSYARSDVLEKRRDLMTVWARFITEPDAGDKVVALARKA